MIKTDCFILLVWTFRATTLILGQHKYTQPSFLYLVQHQTKTRCVWDVLKCFHPVRVSNRRSLRWLRQIHKWEVVNLTRRGTCERILPSGPWQTTLEETLVDTGVAVMHTLKWGDGHFCLPSRLQKKRTIRSSSRCLFGFSPTHIHATLKVTQHCCFLTGGEALICTRQREILAAEINVYFSAVSISNCSLFPSLLRKHPKGDVRLPKQKHCQTKPAASYGSSQACQKKKKKKTPREVSHFCVQMRASWRYFLHTHDTVRWDSNCFISSESNVVVTSHWPLKCASCYVLRFFWLLQGAKGGRFQAQNEKRAFAYFQSMIHETKKVYSYNQHIGGAYHGKSCKQLLSAFFLNMQDCGYC